jgi:hypothetical protein
VSALARAKLIDEFQIVLKLTQSRAFGNGNVVLHSEPMA